MAMASTNYEFLMVDSGANGRVSNGEVFSKTSFYIPEDDYLPGNNGKILYVFVTDNAFPLLII